MSQLVWDSPAKKTAYNIFSCISLVLFVPLIMWDGFVIMKLWNWFAVAVGAMPIGIALGIGLGLLVNMLVNQNDSLTLYKLSKNTNFKLWQSFSRLVIATLRPAIVLGVGAIVHSFMPVVQAAAEVVK